MARAKTGIYKGVIKNIGAGTVFDGKITEASLIEIGDAVIENVCYDNFIGTYLSNAVDSGEPVAIAVCEGIRYGQMPIHTRIIAIKMNGKIFEPDEGEKWGSMALEMIRLAGPGCVFTIFSFGLALIPWLLLARHTANKINNTTRKLLADLAQATV